jgi:hypothetical protein
MNKPLKKQAVAMLCTNVLRNGVSLSWRKTGPNKKRDPREEQGEGFERPRSEEPSTRLSSWGELSAACALGKGFQREIASWCGNIGEVLPKAEA